MSNEKIEKMLYDAQKKLPTTNMEWRILDMAEKSVEKKRFRVNKAVAACIAFVMFLGIGGGTVLANMEMDIDAGEYGQWVDISSDKSWDSCEWQMEKRGFVLPDKFGEYEFASFSTMLLAKHGTTYLEALTKNVYNPISIKFDDDSQVKETDYWINVSVGALEEAYWSAYYEFEKVDGVWSYSETETILEYEGMIIYGKLDYSESGNDMNWRWMDEKNGVCWSVYVPINTGLENEIDSTEVVKEIIDLNK